MPESQQNLDEDNYIRTLFNENHKRSGLVLASTYNKLLSKYITSVLDKLSYKNMYERKIDEINKILERLNITEGKLQFFNDIFILFDYLIENGEDIRLDELIINLNNQIDIKMYEIIKDITFKREFNETLTNITGKPANKEVLRL